jgi:hypothetical protein
MHKSRPPVNSDTAQRSSSLAQRMGKINYLRGEGKIPGEKCIVTCEETWDSARVATTEKMAKAAGRNIWSTTERAAEDKTFDILLEVANDLIHLPEESAARNQVFREASEAALKRFKSQINGIAIADTLVITKALRRDIMLMASLTAVRERLSDEERALYLDHSEQRIRAWEQGFVVLGSLDKNLYIYRSSAMQIDRRRAKNTTPDTSDIRSEIKRGSSASPRRLGHLQISL